MLTAAQYESQTDKAANDLNTYRSIRESARSWIAFSPATPERVSAIIAGIHYQLGVCGLPSPEVEATTHLHAVIFESLRDGESADESLCDFFIEEARSHLQRHYDDPNVDVLEFLGTAQGETEVR